MIVDDYRDTPPANWNLHEIALKLTPENLDAFFESLPRETVIKLFHSWSFLARAEQRPPKFLPDGVTLWQYWLYLAGRGSGKTRSGAEWIREQVMNGEKHLALIAPTNRDIRTVMIEGSSGLLSVSWKEDVDIFGKHMGKPEYEPSKGHQLTWANGATAHGFSAEEPDRLRGPQHGRVWCDELAAWQYAQETWDMMLFGLRLGEHPQVMISTTPRPIPIIRALLRDPNTVFTKSSTYANRANLAKSFLDKTISKYKGTRLGRQELYAEILEEMEGALWSRATIEKALLKHGELPHFTRIVVSIDPAITANPTSNLTGIIVAALGADMHGYILEDSTGKYSPDEWGKEAVRLYDYYQASRIVAEGNQGGDMVRHTINTVRKNLPISIVHATRSKQARAEPVAALYEQGRVHHVHSFPELEDQMCVAGDTLITTARGLVAACDVKISDRVLTRSGFYPLRWVGSTGIKPTIIVENGIGSQVQISYNHPVYVEARGFVRADSLVTGDQLVCHSPLSGHTLSLMESNISLNKLASMKDIIAQAAKAVANSFMLQFGKRNADQFLAEIISIIMTATLPQQMFANLNVLRQKNMRQGMIFAGHLPNHQVLEANAAKQNGLLESLANLFASFATANMKREAHIPIIALENVVGCSTISAMANGNDALLYDLTVDGPPEFFGNGILLHNCTWEPLSSIALDSGRVIPPQPSPDRLDAMVWALTELMLGAHISSFQVPIYTGQLRVLPGQ